MAGIFKTPIAKSSCAVRPNPMVFQLMAFLFLLKINEIKSKTNIPRTPRIKLFIENPRISAVLNLSLRDVNKQKIVDYLNTTTAILSQVELERKNQYATNTIKFIDSSLAAVNDNLKGFTDDMNAFRRQNKVFDVSDEISQISAQLKVLEGEKEAEQSKLNYLNNLQTYLETKTNYTNIAAPTSVRSAKIPKNVAHNRID